MYLPALTLAQLQVENNQVIFNEPSLGSFGAALAVADIDDDGFPDIVLGDAEFTVNHGQFPNEHAGRVVIIYNDHGQFPQETFFWDTYIQNLFDPPNWAGNANEDELFGHAVATGDFNGDSFTDVVAGAPGDRFLHESTSFFERPGTITVAHGVDGPGFNFSRAWNQNAPQLPDTRPGLLGNGADGERFGWALAVGNFNGDEYDDVAIGVPGETLNGSANATGAVNIVYGSPAGFTTTNEQFIHQATPFVVGAAEAGDEFGDALVSGNFNCDEYDDLVAGIHREAIGTVQSAGAAVVMYGGPSGLGDEVLGSESFHQGRADVFGAAEAGDQLGSSLASGDFNGDGCDDLAVGIPFEDVDTSGSAGGVLVFFGSPTSGLTAVGDQFIDGSWAEAVESSDNFGAALVAGDFNDDGKDDLAIGIPGEEFDGGPNNAGAVNIIYGSATGLVAEGSEVWHAGTPGIVGDPGLNAEFGAGLATGEFNFGDKADLVIGAPNFPMERGTIHILYTDAPMFESGFEQ